MQRTKIITTLLCVLLILVQTFASPVPKRSEWKPSSNRDRKQVTDDITNDYGIKTTETGTVTVDVLYETTTVKATTMGDVDDSSSSEEELDSKSQSNQTKLEQKVETPVSHDKPTELIINSELKSGDDDKQNIQKSDVKVADLSVTDKKPVDTTVKLDELQQTTTVIPTTVAVTTLTPESVTNPQEISNSSESSESDSSSEEDTFAKLAHLIRSGVSVPVLPIAQIKSLIVEPTTFKPTEVKVANSTVTTDKIEGTNVEVKSVNESNNEKNVESTTLLTSTQNIKEVTTKSTVQVNQEPLKGESVSLLPVSTQETKVELTTSPSVEMTAVKDAEKISTHAETTPNTVTESEEAAHEKKSTEKESTTSVSTQKTKIEVTTNPSLESTQASLSTSQAVKEMEKNSTHAETTTKSVTESTSKLFEEKPTEKEMTSPSMSTQETKAEVTTIPSVETTQASVLTSQAVEETEKSSTDAKTSTKSVTESTLKLLEEKPTEKEMTSPTMPTQETKAEVTTIPSVETTQASVLTSQAVEETEKSSTDTKTTTKSVTESTLKLLEEKSTEKNSTTPVTEVHSSTNKVIEISTTESTTTTKLDNANVTDEHSLTTTTTTTTTTEKVFIIHAEKVTEGSLDFLSTETTPKLTEEGRSIDSESSGLNFLSKWVDNVATGVVNLLSGKNPDKVVVSEKVSVTKVVKNRPPVEAKDVVIKKPIELLSTTKAPESTTVNSSSEKPIIEVKDEKVTTEKILSESTPTSPHLTTEVSVDSTTKSTTVVFNLRGPSTAMENVKESVGTTESFLTTETTTANVAEESTTLTPVVELNLEKQPTKKPVPKELSETPQIPVLTHKVLKFETENEDTLEKEHSTKIPVTLQTTTSKIVDLTTKNFDELSTKKVELFDKSTESSFPFQTTTDSSEQTLTTFTPFVGLNLEKQTEKSVLNEMSGESQKSVPVLTHKVLKFEDEQGSKSTEVEKVKTTTEAAQLVTTTEASVKTKDFLESREKLKFEIIKAHSDLKLLERPVVVEETPDIPIDKVKEYILVTKNVEKIPTKGGVKAKSIPDDISVKVDNAPPSQLVEKTKEIIEKTVEKVNAVVKDQTLTTTPKTQTTTESEDVEIETANPAEVILELPIPSGVPYGSPPISEEFGRFFSHFN